MGNCINHEVTNHWGGDDWGSLTSDAHFSPRKHRKSKNNKFMKKMEEETLLKDDGEEYKSSNTTKKELGSNEVKIKITKKQLEELFGMVEGQGISVQQVLAQLMNGSDHYDAHQRGWRPNLESIPEV